MQTTRRLVPAAILVLGIVLVAGCSGDDNNGGGGGGGGTPNSIITIVPGAFTTGMMAFNPPIDTVHVGQTVRMNNGDSQGHNIQPDAGAFPSWGSIPGGAGVTLTASAAGTFPYHCTVNGHTMNGTLVVLP
jgi:plastocyanin